MAFDTFNVLWVPTWGARLNKKTRQHVAPFGDGFKQISEDGLNAAPQVWNLKWDVEPAVADAIDDWLDAHRSVPFKWTNPRGVQIVVNLLAGEYDHTLDTYGTHTVTAIFEQNYTPETP